MKHLLFIAAVPLILASPAKAHEEVFDDWASQVRTADLNLSTAAGQSRLLARVTAVAKRKCRPQVQQTISNLGLTNTCVQSAVEAARPQIESAIALVIEPARIAAGGGAGTLSSVRETE